MRAWILAACAACGPISPAASPQGGAATPPPSSGGPPGGTADTWGATPAGDAPTGPDRDRDPPLAPRPASPRPAQAGLSADAATLVTAHNRVRAKHCAPPLTWSPKLAEVAQRWANKLKADGCTFGHSGGAYGENLAAGTTGAMDPEAVVAMWYDEVKGYSFKQPAFSMQTGHFTQVVWTTTTQVGCGMAQCKGNDIWVCEYDPPGNWEGQYRQHVLPTSCR